MAHHFFAQELSLLMRYHVTADRGFNKCLADLRKLQKDRQMREIGFVPQEEVVEQALSPVQAATEEEPASDPYAKVEKRRESDKVWAKFFPRRQHPHLSPSTAS